MDHSPKFNDVMKFYNLRRNGKRLWDERKVADAVKKGMITPEEFQEITGQPYEEV